MMTFETDYTSVDYNSYATVVEIDTLVSEMASFTPTSIYTGLSEAEKQGLIKNASQNVSCFDFKGVLNTSVTSQFNMQFPRSGMNYTNGIEIPSDLNPPFLKQYIAERCLEILEFGPADANGVTVPKSVKREKLDVLEQEFFTPSELNANKLTLRDFQSYQHLKNYVKNSGSVIHLLRA